MENSKISVLMSAYNNAGTVASAIVSILNQTYANFEFIIVDDASTDNSLEVIKSFAKKDARITVIENKTNAGLAVCLNTAFAHATGDYIARQDAHGLSLPDRFAIQMRYFNEHPAVDVLGMGQPFNAKLLMRKNIMVHGSVMMRTKTLRDAGAYNPNYRYVQDYELWRRLLKSGAGFANLPAGKAGLSQPLYQLGPINRSLKETSVRLLYLMNAKQSNKEILPLSKLPLIRKLEFYRYILRAMLK